MEETKYLLNPKNKCVYAASGVLLKRIDLVPCNVEGRPLTKFVEPPAVLEPETEAALQEVLEPEVPVEPKTKKKGNKSTKDKV